VAVSRIRIVALVCWLAAVCGAADASAGGCPTQPVRLVEGGISLDATGEPLPADAPFTPVRLPDAWRTRRPEAGGLAWYRFTLDTTGGDEQRCAIYLPDVNMNAAVWVNGEWVGEGGSMTDPVAHNFNRPLYFQFPGALLAAQPARIDVLLYAYAHHFGRLGPIWIGPHEALVGRYQRAYFRQVTLAEIGTVAAAVTAVGIGLIWASTGWAALYGFFFASTAAWAINSLNYWVRDVPFSHWTWDRLVNGALDQFAVFLALFFHRLLGVRRPRLERLLFGFGAVAAVAAVVTPRAWFAETMMLTHVAITAIGAYVTALSWSHRRALTTLEARVYLGAWLAQLIFSTHDLGIQLGLWRGVGYTLPYTVSCMMLAFGTTLGLRYVRALREALALNEKLEERVREREDELSRQFDRTRDLERRDILSRERQRLMREMHDGLGGHLVSSLALVESTDDADPEIVAALRDGLDELRLVIMSLDAGFTAVPALLASLRERLEPTLERRGIRFKWGVGDAPTPRRFGPEQMLSLLRIVQEAITNSVKHTQASTIEVTTAVDGDTLLITVRDDGGGFAEIIRRGRGLDNMTHRASELGGTLRILSDDGGTLIALTLPLD
jgi:signal transduction histidine kinase